MAKQRFQNPYKILDVPNANDVAIKNEEKLKIPKIKRIIKLLCFSAYTIVVFLLCFVYERDNPLFSHPIITLSDAINSFIRYRCGSHKEAVIDDIIGDLDPDSEENKRSDSKLNVNRYKNCKTISEIIDHYRNPDKPCDPAKKYVTDFSFLKRTPESPIKNLIIIFLESTRNDVHPFNYTSYFATHFLYPEAKKDKNITPFLEKIMNRSIFSTNAKAICSVTIKAQLAALCSMFTYPGNYNIEYKMKFYKICLAELLKKYANMSTAYIHPSTDYANHRDQLERMGFEKIIFGDDYATGIYGPPLKKWINIMGYEDGPFRKIMMDWIDEQLEKNQNFFLTYGSSVTHTDFETPSSWPKKNLVKVKICNQYINAVRYMDNFLEQIFEDFKARNLLENTLFVILGDHGLACGENGVWFIPEITYETQYSIPMMFYTENKMWRKRFPPKMTLNQWHDIDLLPSILDSLRFNGTYEEFNDEYLYEGQSVLRQSYKSQVQFSFSSPGFHAVIMREGKRKVVLPGIGHPKESIFDLYENEHEDHPLKYDEISDDFQNWIREMRDIKKLYIYHLRQWYRPRYGKI